MVENLICYKEGRTQKWIVTSSENDSEILVQLLMNPKIDNSTIFAIPACGVPFGIWWVGREDNRRSSLYKFFKEFGKKQPKLKMSETEKAVIEEVQAEAKAKRREKLDSKYGFISPNGKYYKCDFEGHYSLAYDICTYRYDIEITNPERYLLERGWCKIFNPMDQYQRHAIHLDLGFSLNREQYKTLQDLGLENAKHVKEMLLDDRI